jgi:hypothetical protein
LLIGTALLGIGFKAGYVSSVPTVGRGATVVECVLP